MATSRRAISALFFLLMQVTMGSVLACEEPESPATFVINHETYGHIGQHALTFHCDGDDLIVETDVAVDVRVLFVTVYQRRAKYREVWRRDRLVSYDAWTDEAGDEYVTKARIKDDRMIIDGVKPGITAPVDTVSSHPWNINVVDRNLLFGMKDGRLLQVDVEPAGEEVIDVADKSIKARKYVVSGDIERELWYDQAGNWLRWRLESRGNVVDIVRQ
ncbi:MAG: DUF6134 family protein [Geminicoccaceae bacterium]